MPGPIFIPFSLFYFRLDLFVLRIEAITIPCLFPFCGRMKFCHRLSPFPLFSGFSAPRPDAVIAFSGALFCLQAPGNEPGFAAHRLVRVYAYGISANFFWLEKILLPPRRCLQPPACFPAGLPQPGKCLYFSVGLCLSRIRCRCSRSASPARLFATMVSASLSSSCSSMAAAICAMLQP